jgi:transcriptional regulator with XRE-family HTH domain
MSNFLPKDATMNTIGDRLKHARELKEYSQGDIARKADLSKGAISLAERNLTSLTIHNLAALCKVLGVSADYVVFGESVERDDSWKQISSTKEGVSLKRIVSNLYKDKRLKDFLVALSTMKSSEVDVLITVAKTMHDQSK